MQWMNSQLPCRGIINPFASRFNSVTPLKFIIRIEQMPFTKGVFIMMSDPRESGYCCRILQENREAWGSPWEHMFFYLKPWTSKIKKVKNYTGVFSAHSFWLWAMCVFSFYSEVYGKKNPRSYMNVKDNVNDNRSNWEGCMSKAWN